MRGRGEFGGRRGGGGGSGRGPGGDGDRRPRGERANMRTVYTLASTNAPPDGALKPEPKQVRLGISDGLFTEVLDGLKEGDIVIVGAAAQDNPLLQRPGGGAANPFGGGGRRGF